MSSPYPTVTPPRRPQPPSRPVVDSLHCVRARHGRQLGTATCVALPSKVGCAPLHSGLRSAMRCAPFRSAPTRRPQTEAPWNQFQ